MRCVIHLRYVAEEQKKVQLPYIDFVRYSIPVPRKLVDIQPHKEQSLITVFRFRSGNCDIRITIHVLHL